MAFASASDFLPTSAAAKENATVAGLRDQWQAKRQEHETLIVAASSARAELALLRRRVTVAEALLRFDSAGKAEKELRARRESLAADVADGEGLVAAAAKTDALKNDAPLREALAKRVAEAKAKLTATDAKLKEAGGTLLSARTELGELWVESLATAPLKPLSPEQLGWTVLEATGVLQNYRTSGVAEIQKTAKKAKPTDVTPAELEAWLHAKLKPSVDAFVGTYAAAAGQPQSEFFSTVDQALFTTNGGTILSWLPTTSSAVLARAGANPKPDDLARETFMVVLSRPPTAAETADFAATLAKRPKEPATAIQNLAWALLASAEFRFNH